MRILRTTTELPYVLTSERYPELDMAKGAKAAKPHPKAGQPFPDATIWKLRGLTSRENGALQDSMFDFGNLNPTMGADGKPKVDMNLQMSPSDQMARRVRIGLCGWDNLRDEDGAEVPFTPEELVLGRAKIMAAPEAVIAAMPTAAIKELDAQIRKINLVEYATGNV